MNKPQFERFDVVKTTIDLKCEQIVLSDKIVYTLTFKKGTVGTLTDLLGNKPGETENYWLMEISDTESHANCIICIAETNIEKV